MKIDYFQIAYILLFLLPTKGKLTICIDRTNWEFGDLSINVLAATVYCKGVGIPIFFELLDNNGGNSNTEQRKYLIPKILRLIPAKRIECVIADREFVGFDWWQFLIKNKITFFIRCKQDTKIIRDKKKRNAMDWAYAIRARTFNDIHIEDIKSKKEICCNVAIKRIGYKVKGDNYLIVLTNADPKLALQVYKKRWSIEVFFQSIKGRGFQLEKTQMDSLKDIKKLFALVSIAFAICFATGVWKDKEQQSIPIKNHGYKECSFFKYGQKQLFSILKNIEKRAVEVLMFCDLIINIINENTLFWKEQKTNILVKKSFVT